jgi:hypothetical protein
MGSLDGLPFNATGTVTAFNTYGGSSMNANANRVLLMPADGVNSKLFNATRGSGVLMAASMRLREPYGNTSFSGAYSVWWDNLGTLSAGGSLSGWLVGPVNASAPQLRAAVRGGVNFWSDGTVVNNSISLAVNMWGSAVAAVQVPAGTCTSCSGCITTVTRNMATVLSSTSVTAVATRFNTTCQGGLAAAPLCASVSSSIVNSNSSAMGKRPGLLCQMLRLCTVLATQPMGYGNGSMFGGNGSMFGGNGTMFGGPNGTWGSNGSSLMPSNPTVKPSRHLLQSNSTSGSYSPGPMQYGPPGNSSMGYPGPGGPYPGPGPMPYGPPGNNSMWYPGPGGPYPGPGGNPGPGGYYGYMPVDPITAMAQMVQDMQYQLGARGNVRVLADVGSGCPPTLVANSATGILGAVDLCSTDGTMGGPAAPGVLAPAGKYSWLEKLLSCQPVLQ